MICNLCGEIFKFPRKHSIHRRAFFGFFYFYTRFNFPTKCIICKRNFCLRCRPFNDSPICNDHFKNIPKNKLKEFEDFCIKNDDHHRKIYNIWILLFTIGVITGALIIIPLELGGSRTNSFLIFGSFSIFILITSFFLIIKKRNAKIKKMWQELAGNPIIE